MPFKPYLIYMMLENIKDNYYIVKLTEKHDLNKFSCGLEDRTTF